MITLYIHSFLLSDNRHLIAGAGALLAEEELARAARFKVEPAREEFLISHLLLRQTLSGHLGSAAAALRYRYGEHGKPSLDHEDLRGCRFNLSHSGDRCLVAISTHGETGVDIERVKSQSDPLRLAKHVMAPQERRRMCELGDPAARQRYFFAQWARKEAFVKALGRGFSFPLAEAELQSIADGRFVPQVAGYQDYLVIDIEIADDYAAAAALHLGDSQPAEAVDIVTIRHESR